MSAEVVDAVCQVLGRGASSAASRARPLPGGDVPSFGAELEAARRAIGRGEVAERLVSAYGSRWRMVWRYATDDPALASELSPGLPYIAAELVHGVEREMACTLGDLLIRRTHLAFETADHGASAARAAATVLARAAGWDASETARQLEAYERESDRIFRIEAPETEARAAGS